jgi:cell wall assembly regulator SMI1
MTKTGKKRAKPQRARKATHRAEGDVPTRWKTIEAWLREHHPRRIDDFRPPAQTAAVAAAEKELGRELPEDYKQFLSLHDGQELFAPMVGTCSLFSLDDVPLRYRRLASLLSDAEEESEPEVDAGIRPVAYSPGWIPIGVSARGRDYLCIDLDPAPKGTSGQIIEVPVDFDDRTKVAPSFADLLALYFKQLQTGEIEVDDD